MWVCVLPCVVRASEEPQWAAEAQQGVHSAIHFHSEQQLFKHSSSERGGTCSRTIFTCLQKCYWKKRKDKSLLPLLWSSWCHWCPVLPHKFEYFEQVFKKKTRWRNSETTKCENGSRSIFESSVHLYMLKKRQINKKKKNAEGKQDKQWKYQRHLPLKNPLYQLVYFPICEERVCWFFTPAVTNDSDGSLMEDEFWIWPFTKIVCF